MRCQDQIPIPKRKSIQSIHEPTQEDQATLDEVFFKRVQIKLNKEYSIGQLNQIKKQLESKEGTTFQQIMGKQQLIMICEQDKPDAKDNQSKSFKLVFKIKILSEFEDLIQNQSGGQDRIDFGVKSFHLIQFHDKHSEKCKASLNDDIFSRNMNFLETNTTRLQDLIHQRYKSTQKPESPQDYIKHISDHLGYDFILYGVRSSDKKPTETQKEKIKKLKRFFDNNVLKKARQKYGIPPFQKKIIKKKPKPKYQVDNEEKDFENNQKDDLNYRISIREKNRKVGQTMNLRKRKQKLRESQNQ